MKFIKRILFSILLSIGVIFLLTGIAYGVVKVKYNVDLINVVRQVNKLAEPVYEKELCPEAYSYVDLIERDKIFKHMFMDISLTDKQTAALADTIIKEEYNSIELAGHSIPIELKQIDFKNISNGNTDFNVVAKLDIRELKNGINNGFVEKNIIKHIPEYIYISSTFRVEKTSTPFEYIVKHISLTINNIQNDDIEEIIRLVNIFKNIGTLEELNSNLGNKIMDILVGNDAEPGVAVSMKKYGATDYMFIEKDGKQYFTIVR